MKIIYFLFFLFVYTATFSQVEDAWVYFKDKRNSEAYLTTPSTMLTQKAIDRRIAQNIPFDILDVPIEQSYINQITASIGVTVKAKSKWLNCAHVRGSLANINALKLFSFVDHLDFANHALNTAKIGTAKKTKNLPVNKTVATAGNYDYGNSANQIQMLNGHLLHQLNYTGSGKVIAVLDSGFPNVNTAQPFQRLISNGLILGGYDYVNKNSNFYTGNSHGTLVLSLMGGYKDGQLIGTAPDAKYYLYITEDNADENPVEESYWVEAAEEADRVGVDIITTSLGYFDYGPNYPAYSHTYSDMTGNVAFASQGANIAFSKGIIVVASAGNEGNNPTEKHIGVPAEALNVIAVGAVKSDKTYASFSSIGPSFDGRVKPDVMAQGQNPYFSDTSGNIVNNSSGTSFSCPITAGLIACLWQALPTMTNKQIKELIIQSADKFSTPTNQLGYGIPDFNLAFANGLSIISFSESDLVIYPNPTKDLIKVNLPENSSPKKLYIYSVLGQKVLEKEVFNQSSNVTLKSLENGVYFYKIEGYGFYKSGKIIKQ
ncbi:S8 family serine peptidase [Flavobacterium sp.]|uniref:S8 family serine peptidase n=1 Tax=Flavobacterium sp. TaxID=239 RepID=UPI0038FD2FC9